MEDNYKRNNRIAEALNIRGMKQVDLCERTGIKKSSVNGWIKQNWQPKQNALYKMAQALEVSEMWLAGYDVPMERPDYTINNDDRTYTIEIKSNNIDRKHLVNLVNTITELNKDQIDTIESLVNQLHKLNNKE